MTLAWHHVIGGKTAVAKYEAAGSLYPAARFAQLAAAHTPCDEIIRVTKELTPCGFHIYTRAQATWS